MGTTNLLLCTLVVMGCVTPVSGQAHPEAPHLRPFGGDTGLVVIGSVRDGWAIATDGAQVNADGTVSRAEKLFPIGKTGAVAIAGSVSIQDPVARPVREELDLVGIVKGWTDSHPDASLDDAIREITKLVSQKSSHFLSARNPGKQAGKYIFALIFAGYANEKPVLQGTWYFEPAAKGKPQKTEPINAAADPGTIFVFGPSAVAMELLTGKSPALKKFKFSEAIKNYKSSSPQSLTAEQLSAVLSSIIEATESRDGKALSHGGVVAPPNKAAVISKAQGFTWK